MKVELQGGTGFFLADFAPNTVGMNTMNGEIGVSGGCFTFSGNEFALFASEASCTVERLKNVQTYVSENSLGRGKSLWTSGLTDELVTTLSQESAYRYVEFLHARAACTADRRRRKAVAVGGDCRRGPAGRGVGGECFAQKEQVSSAAGTE